MCLAGAVKVGALPANVTGPSVMPVTQQQVLDALKELTDPNTRKDFVTSKSARNVTVEGKLTGDVSADERVELVAGSAVDGNIKAPKIIVAEGARFRGSVDMGSSRPKDADPAHPAPAKG